ncbi:lactonase family protein [uncultured Rubinisphaera sp.]|uniref:lactonase family protein n=1 Tax=uncultured Rubinisphaera sp. TaxID=1678686 RepID=UPI0030D8A943
MKLISTAAFALITMLTSSLPAAEQWIYIASRGKLPVIYRASLDLETGKFGNLEVAADNVQTGFMDAHPTLSILYAATTESGEGGIPDGGVRAYQIDLKTGSLVPSGLVSTHDSGTTHIEVSPQGNALAVCHYGGDGTTAIRLNKAGELQPQVSQIKHQGSSVDPKRQTKPHPHGVAFSHDGKYLLVADLGNDHVEVFAVDKNAGIKEHTYWTAAPGAGPRHVTLHPTKDIVYSINELDSTISVLSLNTKSGELTEVQTVQTLPKDYDGKGNTTAEIVVHPSGNFVYGSNRGHNSTAVYSVDDKTNKLTLIEHEPTQGDHPRFVGMDPTGSIYLAANMNSNNIVSFRVNQKTGKLESTGNTLEVSRPMCVVFIEKK